MKRHPSRWISLTALTTMSSLFASPLLSANIGDPNGPAPFSSLPLVVPSVSAPAPAPVQPVAPQQPQGQQPAPAGAVQDKFTAAQLQEMVAAIALYPDPLLAQILAGATYPLDIVQASRFIKANAKDPALAERIAAQPWDPSVQALARYPSVLALMDENLEWTQSLGAAFLYQQEDVMTAVQTLRAQAQAAGNLATTQQQKVVVEERIIYIEPADPQVIYVPAYEPEIVYVERPSYYVGSAITFGFGFAVGSWLDLDCDWRHHNVYRGGWYHRHHSHHNHSGGSGHKDGYRDRDDDRHDSRNDRYDSRDGRRDDDRDRRDSVWRHDASKPAPQIRSAPERTRVATPVYTHSGSSNSSPVVRDDRRSERDGDNRHANTASQATSSSDRSRNGYVRPTPGYVRPVSSPVSPTLANREGLPGDRGNSDRSDRGDRRAGEGRVDAPPVSRIENRPTFNGGNGDGGRSADGNTNRPIITPRPTPAVTAPAPTPAASSPAVRPAPAPRAPVAPPRIETPAHGVRSSDAVRSIPSQPTVEAPRTPTVSPSRSSSHSTRPSIPAPAPAPRATPAPSVSVPSPRSTPAPSAPAVRSAPTRVATPPSAPAPRPTVAAPKPSHSSASSSKPSIASERSAGNAASRERSSSSSSRGHSRSR